MYFKEHNMKLAGYLENFLLNTMPNCLCIFNNLLCVTNATQRSISHFFFYFVHLEHCNTVIVIHLFINLFIILTLYTHFCLPHIYLYVLYIRVQNNKINQKITSFYSPKKY